MNTETKEPQNLMDGLFSEMNRVREIIKEYEHPSLNGAGFIAAEIMKLSIIKAEISIKQGDVINMLVMYNKLKEYDL
jgi:hypothetical protein